MDGNIYSITLTDTKVCIEYCVRHFDELLDKYHSQKIRSDFANKPDQSIMWKLRKCQDVPLMVLGLQVIMYGQPLVLKILLI